MKEGPKGWLPPELRSRHERAMTYEFHEQIRTFSEVGRTIENPPERCIWAELEQKHLGRLLPRNFQQTGSCVGAGGFVAACKSQLGDRLHRQDNELLTPFFPWSVYGHSRKLAGMRRRGSGSFGSAFAKAIDDSGDGIGVLPYDDPRFPQPQIIDGNWWKYTEQQELEWSYSPQFPVDVETLKSEGQKFGMQSITRLSNANDVVQLTAQGHGITLASMYGSRSMRNKGRAGQRILVASWNARWPHQMSVGGYWTHPEFGLMILIDNQWSKRAHPQCETLAEFGSNGSFWIPENDFNRICRDGEVYAFSDGGFEEERTNLWDNLW